MGSNANNARQKWERAFQNYIDLNLRLQQAQEPRDCEAIGTAIAVQQDKLMVLRARHLPAILQKLYIVFGDTVLDGRDRESKEKRLLMQDLEELIEEAVALFAMIRKQQPVRTLGLRPSFAPSRLTDSNRHRNLVSVAAGYGARRDHLSIGQLTE
jgi:hypothetical protein